MTDRYNALIVVLDRDIRDDDAEHIMNAIRMIKHVKDVQGNVADIADIVAESRVKEKIRGELYSLIKQFL